jgi:hypothetical protein
MGGKVVRRLRDQEHRTASCLWQQHRLPQAHKVSQSDGFWHGLHDSDSSAHCSKNRRSLPSLQLTLIHSCLLQQVMMSVCRPVVISSSDTEPGCLSVCRLAQRSFSSKAHRRTSSATRDTSHLRVGLRRRRQRPLGCARQICRC